MGKYVKAFVKDESGMETIEFVVILAIVLSPQLVQLCGIKQTKRKER